jgi:hypothetical protein
VTAPAVITSGVRSRLAALLRLLLSTNQTGEVIAAKTAIVKTLASNGLDLHALAAAVESPSTVGQSEPATDPMSWRAKVQYCSVRDELMTQLEVGFINTLRRWRGRPTPKQSDCLDQVYDRVKLREGE